MKSYKIGDKVRCINPSLKDLEEGKTYKISWCYGSGLIVLEEVDGSWSLSNFELLQEEDIDMKGKFKVGDKVVRVSKTYGEAVKGEVYEISEVSGNECFGNNGINLKGHKCASGRFIYEAGCFELYVDGILTPLEAAEALLNKDKLQIFDSDANKWCEFHNELRNITLEHLKHIKLRHKPKTLVINGVEVPAPLSKKPSQEFIYFINLFKSRVYLLPTEKLTFNHKNYWATEEDAQKALDAMLIPFNNLNKGDKQQIE